MICLVMILLFIPRLIVKTELIFGIKSMLKNTAINVVDPIKDHTNIYCSCSAWPKIQPPRLSKMYRHTNCACQPVCVCVFLW